VKRLLIADDDAGMRAALEARFLRLGWQVDVAVNGADALHKFRQHAHALVITDVRMPGRDGFELMREVQAASPRTAVILLTAYGCVPDAVTAIQNGACDYLVKPVCFEKLELAVEQVLRRAQADSKDTQALVGRSPAWQQALERARQAAASDADILIEAESGTGKELVARLIHRLSGRKSGPFVALNCTAFPEALLESELFGHAKGAFTGAVGARPGKFEMANGGTLLLDEVGEMPLSLQPKLLRALQEREFDKLGSDQTVRVDIRVIATTAMRLAQKFLAETEPASEPSSEHKEALQELLRQIAGQAATALGASVGGEVQLQLTAAAGAPAWSGASTWYLRTRDEAGTPVVIEIQINAELASALKPRAEAHPEPAAGVVAPPVTPFPPEGASYQRLMDVGLEVKLRFGSRRMVLRDILALSAGIVVELDSSVNSPVDLLLDGRTIAQGEVVVVDGKYGLRVTQVFDPRPPM